MKANKYARKTASALIQTGYGVLKGMYVNSTSSGTIKLYDGTDTNGVIINNTITPAVGYHNLGSVAFTTGLYVTIGGTLDVTLHFE